MDRRIQRALLLGTLGVSIVSADTITTRDHLSFNGSIVKMANGEITIVARYPAAEKTLPIKTTDVEVIEFNTTTFNSGAPPRAIGIGPPLKVGNTPALQSDTTDTVVLRGAQRRACKLIGIDERIVHCAGKDGDYPRKIVLRIVLMGVQ